MNDKRQKILIIGPFPPFRGGIAQHTRLLYRTLSKKHKCLAISFSRQYPRWLYPGKSDRDPNALQEEGAEYILDSVNPLSWFKVYRRALNFSADLVVFPWWHVYWAICFGWLANAFRKRGCEVVFICHNVFAHEDNWLKRQITKLVFSRASNFVVHTQEDRLNLIRTLPDAKVSTHPLPIFEQFPISKNPLSRRGKLELLFFGFVRHYKGLDVFIDAISLLKDNDIHVSIVGEFWTGEEDIRQQISLYGLEALVEIVSGYVNDAEAAEYFTRADAIVLPYRSATGSAVIPLAYFYEKPVIATSVGGLPDVVEDGLSGLLVKPDSPDELASAILKLYKEDFIPNLDSIRRLKEKMTWASYVHTLVSNKQSPIP